MKPVLLPLPAKIEWTPDQWFCRKNPSVHVDPAGSVAEAVLRQLGLAVDPNPAAADIRLSLDPAASTGPEGYRLEVATGGVVGIAASSAGLFYAIQTLAQLAAADTAAKWGSPVDCCRIEDRPRFGWRGLMIDTCRYFMPPAFLYKLVDALAMHKLNSLHIHLTEDQGWRFESLKYPLLTEIGSVRKRTIAGHLSDTPRRYDEKPHGGFYTQKELRELVRYAADRHVRIVPEIEMPGHAQAAIAAYPRLGAQGSLLEVFTDWGISPNILNAEPETIRFFQDVLEEVMDVFPSPFIHIGGDEAPKDQWDASPRMRQLITQRGLKDSHEMQSWFIRQMDGFLTGHGRRLIGWDEILEGGLAPNATVMSWRGEEGGIAAANAGHDVVMAPHSHTYFDHYQADPQKEPLAIGGLLPLERVYAYDPIPAALVGTDAAKHVLGTQGQIWTEYIATPEHAMYMAFPRACALAEVAWSPGKNRDFGEFAARLQPHLPRLSAAGIGFRPMR